MNTYSNGLTKTQNGSDVYSIYVQIGTTRMGSNRIHHILCYKYSIPLGLILNKNKNEINGKS